MQAELKTPTTIVRICSLLFLACAFTACRPSKESPQTTPPPPTGRSYPSSAVFTPRKQLAEFTEHGVKVTVSLEADAEAHPLLRATFAPTDPGFHLYGKDLPAGGVKGIGVPTRFEFAPQPAIKVAGPTFSDVPPKDVHIKDLDVTVPIYPEGPVTLRIPIEFTPPDQEITARFHFGYMACKTDGVCLRVVNETLDVKIPASR